ncbi:hypothetical protein Droror1_Dr00000517 [Drosera rotundifolia]
MEINLAPYDHNKQLMLIQLADDEPEPAAPPPELNKPDELFVAVSKEAKRSESVLMWAIQNSGGMKICIIHVHQPPRMVNKLGKKQHISTLKEDEAKAYLEIQRQFMLKRLDSYTATAINFGARAHSVHIERESIEEGILELIFKHKIDKLVMGGAADESYYMQMAKSTSKKAIYVQSHAPAFCSIWFICKGELICTRDVTLPAKPQYEHEILGTSGARAERSSIDHDLKNQAQGSFSKEFFSRSSSFYKEASPCSISRNEFSGSTESPTSSYGEKEDGRSRWHEEQKQSHSRSRGDYSRLESFEESSASQISEGDGVYLTKRLYAQELQRKEVERSLELTKHKLHSAEDENILLVCQIEDYKQRLKDLEETLSSECQNQDNEQRIKELEETLSSIVAQHEIEKEDLLKLYEERANLPAFFCILSRDDINMATNEFDASSQLWEGDGWAAYKGSIAHTTVIVKIFHDALQGELKYQREVEVLSKFRHPNLLTLIGACPDMNSLVFEYTPNGSLEDRLCCRDGAPPLSWKTRVQIAAELCSLLLFLQSRQPQGVVHGCLTPASILLDSTFRCKVHDFWLSHLYPTGDSTGDITSPYIDPEITGTGEVNQASDVYSFGVILLQLLTGKSDFQIRQAVKDALDLQNLSSLLDSSAGEWPLVQAEQFSYLGLTCCDMSSGNRPDLDSGVWRVVKPMWDSCQGLFNSVGGEAPSCFLCPVLQEVMIDPHVAADGYTYEAEAMKGWLDRGKTTSPMTNLPLDNLFLIPNRTLRSAIQEWKEHR